MMVGPGVVGEALVAENVGTATGLIAHLEDRRVVTARLQADGRAESAKGRSR